MNYLTEIIAFYDWIESNQVDSSVICLWHGLMIVANKTGWQEWFSVPMITLELKTGLKRSALYPARNRLRQLNRIEFKERGGNQSSVYRLCPFNGYNPDTTATQQQHNPNTTAMQQQLLYKQNETKQNETKSLQDRESVSPAVAVTQFVRPTPKEVEQFCSANNLKMDALTFIAYYERTGWIVNGQRMANWQAAAYLWARRGEQFNKQGLCEDPAEARANRIINDEWEVIN